jgi:hypothetical protein
MMLMKKAKLHVNFGKKEIVRQFPMGKADEIAIRIVGVANDASVRQGCVQAVSNRIVGKGGPQPERVCNAGENPLLAGSV